MVHRGTLERRYRGKRPGKKGEECSYYREEKPAGEGKEREGLFIKAAGSAEIRGVEYPVSKKNGKEWSRGSPESTSIWGYLSGGIVCRLVNFTRTFSMKRGGGGWGGTTPSWKIPFKKKLKVPETIHREREKGSRNVTMKKRKKYA